MHRQVKKPRSQVKSRPPLKIRSESGSQYGFWTGQQKGWKSSTLFNLWSGSVSIKLNVKINYRNTFPRKFQDVQNTEKNVTYDSDEKGKTIKTGMAVNKRTGCPPPKDQISIRTPNPKRRLYWCLIEFIDWRYSQSCWYFRPLLWTSAPLTFSLVHLPPSPLPCVNKYRV
jgi:hypothetical protein